MRAYFVLPFCYLLFSGVAFGQKPAAMPDSISTEVTVTVKTPANDVGNSSGFYTKLGFHSQPDNPLTFTDGQAVIEIDTVKTARAGFNFYKTSWAAEVELLKSTATVMKTKTGYKLCDPSGVWIYLIESDRKLPPAADSSYSVLGKYQGATIESGNVQASYALYSTLGLQKVKGAAEKGFVILSDGKGFSVAILKAGLSPHLFFNPSLTYFNGKRNLAIIGNIKATGTPITQEINWFNKEGVVDNIIIRDPGGYGFFIFSD
jgi:hypothetical protein